MTEIQRQALMAVALSTMLAFAIWIIIITGYVRVAVIDASRGLGWSLAAAISTASGARQTFAIVGTLLAAGLAAAGSAARPGKYTYVVGTSMIAALASSLYLSALLADTHYLNEIRGTSPFDEITQMDGIRSAARTFSNTVIVALSSALAAMLGVKLWRDKKHA